MADDPLLSDIEWTAKLAGVASNVPRFVEACELIASQFEGFRKSMEAVSESTVNCRCALISFEKAIKPVLATESVDLSSPRVLIPIARYGRCLSR